MGRTSTQKRKQSSPGAWGRKPFVLRKWILTFASSHKKCFPFLVTPPVSMFLIDLRLKGNNLFFLSTFDSFPQSPLGELSVPKDEEPPWVTTPSFLPTIEGGFVWCFWIFSRCVFCSPISLTALTQLPVQWWPISGFPDDETKSQR